MTNWNKNFTKRNLVRVYKKQKDRKKNSIDKLNYLSIETRENLTLKTIHTIKMENRKCVKNSSLGKHFRRINKITTLHNIRYFINFVIK